MADLKLEAFLYDGSELPVGSMPRLGLKLVNTSAVRSYWVVRPGDGSDVGRNPHIYYTATQEQPGGGTVAVPYTVYRTCGNYGWDWGKDVVALPPRTSVRLVDIPSPTIDFQRPGRTSMRAYYVYREGGTDYPGDARRTLLRGVPGFVLESNPVTFDVVRPLDIAVRVKGSWRVAARNRLSDLVVVKLVNRTREPIKCSYPAGGDGMIGGFIECEDCIFPVSPYHRFSGSPGSQVIQPGESVWVPCDNELPLGWVRRWEQGTNSVVRLRAVVLLYVPGGLSIIRSEWFEVPIER